MNEHKMICWGQRLRSCRQRAVTPRHKLEAVQSPWRKLLPVTTIRFLLMRPKSVAQPYTYCCMYFY